MPRPYFFDFQTFSGMRGVMKQQSRVLLEKKLLSNPQKQALVSYVLKKRKKDKEDHSNEEVSDGDKCETSNNDDIINEDTSKAEEDHESPTDTVSIGTLTTSTSITKGKKDHDTLEDVNEQLKSLRDKLEGLRKEKHQLFQELKKVLHEEDEKRQQKQLEQQKLYQSEQESTSVYQSMEGSGTYRNDPRLGKHQHWSTASSSSGYTGYSDGGGPSSGKIPRGGGAGGVSSVHDIPPQYNQQQQQPSYEQDKYPSSPYLQSRIPPQSHMIRPHSMSSPGYPRYRGAGPVTHYGYTPVNTNTPQYGGQPPYQGGVPNPPPGGYIQSTGPLPPPDVIPSGQIYHHQQQQYMSQGIMPPREYQSPPCHFTFEPHQQSRFMIRSSQRPNHMKINPFSPQRDQGSSPSNSPNDRIRYLQQQQQRAKK